ncbi:MAG: hypothetical protein ACYCSF_08670, partial [Acidimicrobiales bacterium]
AASCPTTALVLGIDTVVASYGGDTNHLASSSSTSETVLPEPILVTVSGSQSYGSSAPSFTYTSDAPAGIVLTGAVSCSALAGGTAISSGLAAGTYTIDGSSCSGLASPSPDYTVTYVGSASGFAVPSYCTVSGNFTLPPGSTGGLTSVHNGSIVVVTGQTLFIDGGTVRGSVTVQSGATLLMASGSLSASLKLEPGAEMIAIGGSIGGDVRAEGASVAIAGLSVGGSLQVDGGSLLADGNKIGGSLLTDEASWVAVCGGSVNGSVLVTATTSVPPTIVSSALGPKNYLCDASIGGSLHVQQSPGAPFEIGNGPDCGTGLSVRGSVHVDGDNAVSSSRGEARSARLARVVNRPRSKRAM